MSIIDNFEKMLADGQDNAMLRYGLGQAYLNDGQPEKAAKHLRAALDHDGRYSAAWKLYGKALAEKGDTAAAIEAYGEGIRVAQEKGDIQAAKEMGVFKKRLEKNR
ncbi:MAG TPA: tetratricopeptide repeat protein [Gammaproteobacteria bacterium]|nr:tetratricopeptide repeat protein [Gammaproteobacteria bacterium]